MLPLDFTLTMNGGTKCGTRGSMCRWRPQQTDTLALRALLPSQVLAAIPENDEIRERRMETLNMTFVQVGYNKNVTFYALRRTAWHLGHPESDTRVASRDLPVSVLGRFAQCWGLQRALLCWEQSPLSL